MHESIRRRTSWPRPDHHATRITTPIVWCMLYPRMLLPWFSIKFPFRRDASKLPGTLDARRKLSTCLRILPNSAIWKLRAVEIYPHGAMELSFVKRSRNKVDGVWRQFSEVNFFIRLCFHDSGQIYEKHGLCYGLFFSWTQWKRMLYLKIKFFIHFIWSCADAFCHLLRINSYTTCFLRPKRTP